MTTFKKKILAALLDAMDDKAPKKKAVSPPSNDDPAKEAGTKEATNVSDAKPKPGAPIGATILQEQRTHQASMRRHMIFQNTMLVLIFVWLIL